jgi:hypothetical protein
VLISKGVPIRALQLFIGHKQIQNTKVRPVEPEPLQELLEGLSRYISRLRVQRLFPTSTITTEQPDFEGLPLLRGLSVP